MKTPKLAVMIGIGCAIAIAAGVAIVASIFLVVFGAMRSSDPYKETLRRVQNDPRVVAALGAPVRPGWRVSGNINVINDEGTATLEFTLRGTKKSGTVHVAGRKTRGRWYYQRMIVSPEGAPDIDLLTSSEGSTSTAPPGG